jgi:hypothetical protein
MTGTSKKLWKPILFVALNVFFIVWLGIILEMLLRVHSWEYLRQTLPSR